MAGIKSATRVYIIRRENNNNKPYLTPMPFLRLYECEWCFLQNENIIITIMLLHIIISKF